MNEYLYLSYILIHLDVELFQSGQKWWDGLTNTSIPKKQIHIDILVSSLKFEFALYHSILTPILCYTQ